MIYSEITDVDIDTAALDSRLEGTADGAEVRFSGVIRSHDHDRLVTRLSYEAHPDAARVLGEVASDVRAATGVSQLVVSHRVGPDLPPGTIALYAVVAAPHRAEAFGACARLIDEVKQRLPVWKHQVFDDGSDEWVNSP